MLLSTTYRLFVCTSLSLTHNIRTHHTGMMSVRVRGPIMHAQLGQHTKHTTTVAATAAEA